MSDFSKTTLLYWVLRGYSNFAFRRWFSSIEVNGEMNIPDGEPVIFAPNHQNGLIDAMSLLSTSPQPVVFWARADIFANPVLDKILRALKMMPAYRMRNGFGNLRKNDESMQNSIDVLTHDQFLCLMPEGGQDEKRRLRPLVKGIFRNAFASQEVMKDGECVKIVPVGIDYGHYDRTGRHLVVSYGKAINVKDYMDEYRENAPVVINKVKEELVRRMRPLMLDIRSERYYDAFYVASYLCCEFMLNRLSLPDNETNRLVARKAIAEVLERAEAENETELDALERLCAQWSEGHPDTALAARVAELGGFDSDLLASTLYLLLTSPLFLYAFVFNCIPFFAGKIGGKKMRGTGFEGTFKFGVAGVVAPVLYLLFTVLFGIFFAPTWLHTLCFFLSLPLSFFFMLRYRWRFQYVKERFKNLFRKAAEPSEVSLIVRQFISKYYKDR